MDHRNPGTAKATRSLIATLLAGACTLLISLTATCASAADIAVENSRALRHVYLSGSIRSGDADRLLSLLRVERYASNVILNSPGGSVLEALRLAEVIKKAALTVEVAPNGLCASSCFFIYLAGFHRYAYGSDFLDDAARVRNLEQSTGVKAKGRLGIHRPFEQNLSSPDNAQPRLMRAVTTYLEQQLVPRRLIDIMMARPSNDIYWLDQRDLAELGDYPPGVEEFMIQRCGYDRSRDGRMAIALEASNSAEFDRLNAEVERSSECESLEAVKAQLNGRKQILGGWKPFSR